MIILRAFLILSLLSSWSISAQQDKEVTNLIREAFHEKQSLAYWQLKFSGHTDTGEKVRLFMAYDENEYISYIISENGDSHLFEGPYKPHQLEWVEFNDDRIRGFLRGIREEGMISAEWTDREHKEGVQVFLIQENLEYASTVPQLGAIYVMKGTVDSKSCYMVIDWHLDGRQEVYLYKPDSLVPVRFSQEGNQAAKVNWKFYNADSSKKLSISSPLRTSDIKLRYEPDNTTLEYGEFKVHQSFERSIRKDGPLSLEQITTGKPSFDKRLLQSAESWVSELDRSNDSLQVWFEITDFHGQLLFGQWWEANENSSINRFKSVVIDLNESRILEIEEIFKTDKIPMEQPSGHQLVLNEGKLCWTGPKDWIQGSDTKCLELSKNLEVINRKYRDHFTLKS